VKKLLSVGSILLIILTIKACTSADAKPGASSANRLAGNVYVCIPCGNGCDTIALSGPGACAHCNMELVKKETIVHDNILPQDLCLHITKLGKKNFILLDVRTPDEFNGKAEEKFGSLQHAINIPVQELQERMKELNAYKNKEIIVYCSHSHRSPRASYMLTQNGFTKVTNLQYGMHVWKQEVKDNKCNRDLYVAQ
jgi:rhodanese-related sulfurtransferase/DNA-directed RNA polymerase subunit RPC12/RpoP